MGIRLTLFFMASLGTIYDLLILKVTDEKRKEPLPASVEEIYTAERWKTFLAYKKDMRRPHLFLRALMLALTALMLFSPFFYWLETFSGNVYVHTLIAAFLVETIPFLCQLPVEYDVTFRIREKYGLNRMSRADFWKDQIIGWLFSVFLALTLYFLLTWILESLPQWTRQYQISFLQALLIMALIAGVLIVFMIAASFLSWRILRIQYHFSELEEGELRDQIRYLIRDSRHKVRKIEVYDESKKSTSKNAFVLKLLTYRTIGIADNFLNENSRRELLAVIAHEAGHLKHRRNIWNVLSIAGLFLLFLAGAFCLSKGGMIAQWETWIQEAFGLTLRNTVLSASAAGWFLSPIGAAFSVFRNFVSREEEYEADRNAVAEGYGKDLIQTFRSLSSDELIDVNPADLVEVLELDHPGMAHRIEAIETAMADLTHH